jgi:DNA-binding NarL/FixJ family response regulator
MDTPTIAEQEANPLTRYWFGSTPQMVNLTARETQVVTLLGYGLSNKEIAEVLQPNVRTRAVESHIRNALTKLGLKNRLQICIWAIKHGIVDLNAI